MNKALRVKELDSKVLQPLESGTTRISFAELPETEQELMRKTQEICEYYKTEELTEEQAFLLKEANKRLFFRAFDLFETSLAAWYRTKKDDSKDFILKLRLWYFLFELGRHMEQVDVENSLLKKHKKFRNFEKDLDEWCGKQENRTPLWTRESFTYWFDKFVAEGFNEYKRRKKNRA